tara:strand:- start:444 stop:677 length:234 start_codon:yes stop_codon:yes gene_type:complete
MEHEMETILRTYRGHQIWTLFDDDGVTLWGFDVHAPESVDEPTADPLATRQTLSEARMFIDQEIRERRWDDAAGLNG